METIKVTKHIVARDCTFLKEDCLDKDSIFTFAELGKEAQQKVMQETAYFLSINMDCLHIYSAKQHIKSIILKPVGGDFAKEQQVLALSGSELIDYLSDIEEVWKYLAGGHYCFDYPFRQFYKSLHVDINYNLKLEDCLWNLEEVEQKLIEIEHNHLISDEYVLDYLEQRAREHGDRYDYSGNLITIA